jgi:hypothetical protein
MMGAPSKVPDDLLEELHLGVVDEEG